MTEKELLYMEDAVGHEQNLETIFTNFSDAIEDPKLSAFIEKLSKKHQDLSKKLLNVMEEISNEG